MIKLRDTGLIEGLPQIVASQHWVKVIDAVYRERQRKVLEAADKLHVYSGIDSAPEEMLDILAVQFKVDWYDTGYPLETKRRVIKTALEVRCYCGTEWAVAKAISAIYPSARIKEWYDYGGTPGHWRLVVDATNEEVPFYTARQVEKKLGYARRCTAHLEHVTYTVDPPKRDCYVAGAASGMAMSFSVALPGRIKPRSIRARSFAAGSTMQIKTAYTVRPGKTIRPKAVRAQAFASGALGNARTIITVTIGGNNELG